MNSRTFSRRDFIKAAGVASLAAVVTNPTRAQNNGSRDKIRIGLIGAGSRGTHAGITDCAEADQDIVLGLTNFVNCFAATNDQQFTYTIIDENDRPPLVTFQPGSVKRPGTWHSAQRAVVLKSVSPRSAATNAFSSN